MSTAPQVREINVGEVRNVSVDFTSKLDTGEVLTGTPIVTDLRGELTISSQSVNAEAVVINGSSVAIGGAVLFTVAAGSASDAFVKRVDQRKYTIEIACVTDGGQTLVGHVILDVSPL